MKIIVIFGVVVTASIALLQPAQGAPRRSGHSSSSSSAHHYSASAGYFPSRPRSFSGGARHFYGPSTRFSSHAAFRNRTASGSRLAGSRRAALQPQGFNNRGRVRSSRNWDRSRDHFWHGHRFRFFNNAWVIFDTGFYPGDYGYGYYPYGAYSYYDDGYENDSDASNEYSQEPYPAQSEYDSRNSDSSVNQVQAALARKGYYHGAIDGSVGPGTRNALRRYQRNHGLDATGRVDRPVIEALGLR